MGDAAATLEMDVTALSHWLARHDRATRDILGAVGRHRGGPRLTAAERRRRVEWSEKRGVANTARALGLEYMTLYMWLRNNAPHVLEKPKRHV